jgi:nitrate/nitrite transport system ATP-binding protein
VAFLELSGVSIDFPARGGVFRALGKINLKIAKGEFVSVIGHSDCGKSTALNIVAGLGQATEGGAIPKKPDGLTRRRAAVDACPQ